MTTALNEDFVRSPGLAQLERLLGISRLQKVSVINAPVDSALRLLPVCRTNPDTADVVIAFATRRRDLAWLRAAYQATGSGRTGWIVYCEPGRPGTDLRWDWFLAALRQYGVIAVEHIQIGDGWSAVLLQRMRHGEPDEGLVESPGTATVRAV